MFNLEKIKSKFKFVGILLTVASLVYIIYVLSNYPVDISAIKSKSLTSLLCVFVAIPFISVLSLVIGSVTWRLILEFVSRKKVRQREVADVYLKSNISKYLPGNVIQYAARNFLGAKFGWGQKEVAFSSLLEIILSTMFTLVILGVLILMVPRITDLGKLNLIISYKNVYILLTVAVVVVVAILLWRRVRKRIYSFYLSIKFRDFAIFILKYFLVSFINFLIATFIVIWVFYLFANITLTYGNILIITGASVLAYFIGYVAIGSPAGIGVRESVMILLLTSVSDPGSVIIALALLRISGILGDILAYFAAFVFSRYHKKAAVP
jgi:glycosyltransferase 2 family protein